MATTATLRIPTSLRDDVAELAAARGTSMVDVVSDAVRLLRREQWWAAVDHQLETLTDAELRAHHAETGILDHAAADGLNRG